MKNEPNSRIEDFGNPLSAAEKCGPLVYASECLFNRYPWCTPSLPCEDQGDYYRVAGFYIPKSFSIHDEEIGNYYERTGAFREAERKSAEFYGADETLFGVQGTTWNMRTILNTLARQQRNNGNKNVKVISSPDVHLCNHNSYREYGIGVTYLPINYDNEREMLLPSSPEDLQRKLEEDNNHKKVSGVVITTPTYEGTTAHLDKIVKVSHDYGLPVIVDEAWGAHLVTPRLPKSAMQCGADICAQSIHKQGGGLNQTSVIHFKYGVFDESFFKNLVETRNNFTNTSVNWDLLASIDAARQFLQTKGDEVLGKMIDASEDVRKKVKGINGLSTFGREICDIHKDYIQDVDLTKITVDTTQTGISGDQMSHLLQKHFHIIPERSESRHVQFLTNYRIAENTWEVYHLADALKRITTFCSPRENNLKQNHVKYPTEIIKVAEHYEVYELPEKYKELVKLEDSVGRTSADNVCSYPPGRFVVREGEQITPAHVGYFKELRKRNASIRSKDSSLEKIYVLKPEAVELLERGQKTGDLWAI